MDLRLVSPSDVDAGQLNEGETLLVAGRIACVTSDRLVCADALGALSIEHAGALSAMDAGALVLLRVTRNGASLRLERLESKIAAPPTTGVGEWADLAWSAKGKRLAQRDRVRRAVREWFQTERFLEVETPTLLNTPGLDSDVDAIASEPGWLVTSPEHHMKRLLVGGLPRVYQFAKCFRREELGPRHEPEFTMLEWYRAFSDLEAMFRDTEAIVAVAARTLGVTRCSFKGRKLDLEPPFLRLSVAEAFERHAGVHDVARLARDNRDQYFECFVDRVEPALAEYEQPVFLYAYPASEAALARLCNDDPRWAERFELYVGGLELCNAYGELSSPVEQRRRFEDERARRRSHGHTVYPLDERFLDALVEGMPPAAGNALGFDRLMMVLLDAATLGDVIAFPRQRV